MNIEQLKTYKPTSKEYPLKKASTKKEKKTLKDKLTYSFTSPKKLKETDLLSMHALFQKYYRNHPFEAFKFDLEEKTSVILLKSVASDEIKGFSTIQTSTEKCKSNKKFTSIYSGDTVLDKDYWGSPLLGIAFLKYLWLQKLKSPFTPLYWFLISKGYKTYLLMANNFKTHFPRYEQQTPNYFNFIMQNFYSKKFGKDFDENSLTITPSYESCTLKDDIAEITEEELKNPRIAFFNKQNPYWKSGSELTCVAEMTFFMPIKYFIKKKLKRRRK